MKLFLLNFLKIYQIIFVFSSMLYAMEENNLPGLNEDGVAHHRVVIAALCQDIKQVQSNDKKLKVIVKDNKELFIECEILELSETVKNLMKSIETTEILIPEADEITFTRLYELLKIVHAQIKKQEIGQLACKDYIKRPVDGKFIHKNLYRCLKPSINDGRSLEEIDKIISLSHFLDLPWLTNVMIRFYIDKLDVCIFNDFTFACNQSKYPIPYMEKDNEIIPCREIMPTHLRSIKSRKQINAYLGRSTCCLNIERQKLILEQVDTIIKDISKKIFIHENLLPLYLKQIKIVLVNLVEFSIADYIALLDEKEKKKFNLFQLTSLEGIAQLMAINTSNFIDLDGNYIVDAPDEIDSTIFNGITTLCWNEGMIGLDVSSAFYKKLLIGSNLNTLSLANMDFLKD